MQQILVIVCVLFDKIYIIFQIIFFLFVYWVLYDNTVCQREKKRIYHNKTTRVVLKEIH